MVLPRRAVAGNVTRSLLTTGVLAILVGTAVAHPAGKTASEQGNAGDTIVAPPPTYQANGVTVIEHLGSKLPLDAMFRTSEGKLVTLGDVMAGDIPTILTFNYADCPMLCSQQLNGLVNSIPDAAKPAPINGADGDVAFRIGEQYRIVTISLEPNQSLEKTAAMRARYLERVAASSPKAAAGWTFLVPLVQGDGSQIKRIADVVGFAYTYIPDRAEWAHPAAFIFVSSAGAVTRYVYGIQFEPGVLRESIFKAGLAENSTSAGFMFRCYHFDPDAKDHSRAGVLALRVGAVGAVLLLAVFGLVHFVRRSRP